MRGSEIPDGESEDLDVQSILNYHLKQVLDLVSKSTVEPSEKDSKKTLPKDDATFTRKKNFGDILYTQQTDKHNSELKNIPKDTFKLLRRKGHRANKYIKNEDDTGKKDTVGSDDELQHNTSAGFKNVRDAPKNRPIPKKKRKNKGISSTSIRFLEPSFKISEKLSTSSEKSEEEEEEDEDEILKFIRGTSEEKIQRKVEEPLKKESEDKEPENEKTTEEKTEEGREKFIEIETEEKSEDDDEDDEEDLLDEDEIKINEDYFTIYRTSMYRPSLFVPPKESSSVENLEPNLQEMSTTPETTHPSKDYVAVSESESTSEPSTFDGYSSHTLFLTKMHDKYRAPNVPITLFLEDFTPENRGREVETLLQRYSELSAGSSIFLCNSPMSSDHLVEVIYQRFVQFMKKRLSSLRGKVAQRRRVMAFKKMIEKQILECPVITRDSKTGGFRLIKRLFRSKRLSDDEKRMVVTKTAMKKEPVLTEEDMFHDTRRKTPYNLTDPFISQFTLKSRRKIEYIEKKEIGEFRIGKGKFLTEAQRNRQGIDLLCGSIDYQTTQLARDCTDITDTEDHTKSTSLKDVIKPIESEEKLTISKGKTGMTKQEILEILDTPEVLRWEQLYLVNPNFSLADYLGCLEKTKSKQAKQLKARMRRQSKRRASAVTAHKFITDDEGKNDTW